MSKEYFSHDVDALADIKIIKMMQDYDFTGFGWYWAIVAEIYKNGGRYNFDDLCVLAKSTGIKQENLKTFIDKCINKYTHNDKGLFVSDDKSFWSTSLTKRMELREKRAAARKTTVSERVDIDDIKLVNLTSEEMHNLKEKYGEELTKLAIQELENWLNFGKSGISKKAKQALDKPHYAYFRQDGWVLNNAKEKLAKNRPNWGGI